MDRLRHFFTYLILVSLVSTSFVQLSFASVGSNAVFDRRSNAQDESEQPSGLKFRLSQSSNRPDRAEVFASLLPAGVYDYSYVVRATTPGNFIVSPAKAEEMYQPETFGRTKTERVRIE